jgi:hypothetical protein
MCAPEGVLPGLADLKGSTIKLSYGFDGVGRPAWLVTLPGQPKPTAAYSPQDCGPQGVTVLRPKR